MCKSLLHMPNCLWPVLQKRTMKTTAEIMNALKGSTQPPRFFMYALSTCKYSKAAYYHIKNEMLKAVYDDNVDLYEEQAYFTAVDVKANQYICTYEDKFGVLLDKPKKLSDPHNVQLNQLLGQWCIMEKTASLTKPQVFIHIHPNWHYVGGSNELRQLKYVPPAPPTTTPTVANTQECDLLHLLPLEREGKRTPPIQLKF